MAWQRLFFVALLTVVACAFNPPAMLPISVGKNGQYFIPISLGTPPQTFYVQLDTRSASFAVPDAACSTCAAPFRYGGSITVPLIDVIPLTSFQSSSANPIPCTELCQFCDMYLNNSQQCGVSPRYAADEQIKGLLWSDTVSIGNLSVVSTLLSFNWESPAFETRLHDGVLGLAYESTSPGPAKTLMSTLVSEGLIQDVFGLCLGIYGGYFAVGGTDSRFYKAEALVETPIVELSRYVIRTRGIQISGTPISNRTDIYNPTVIDTTTQHVLLLPSATFNLFYDVFVTKHCSPPNYLYGACLPDRRQTIWAGQCFDFTDEQLDKYPSINVLFESATRGSGAVSITLDPRDYLVEDKTGFRCLDVQPHTNPEIGGILLGANWMQKFYTIFNRKERRIGFAPARDCTGARYFLRQVSGSDQTGTVSRELPHLLKVHLIDLATNASAVGVAVIWSVIKGRGVLSETEVRTDSDGMASVRFTLGENAGTNMVLASVDLALNSPLPFLAEGRQSVIITVFGFLTAVLVVALMLLVYFLNRRIVAGRNSASNTNLALLMDSRQSFSPQRPIRTDVNNSALLISEDDR